jgi:hypothetical protein
MRGLLLLVTATLIVACSTSSDVSSSAPPPATDLPRVVYVALGGDETLNRQLDDPLRDAWTQRVFRTVLPRSAVYVNVARRDATVASARDDQLPAALELQPTIATLWFGDGDSQSNTPASDFDRDLAALTTSLQGAGARVLLLTGQGSDTGANPFNDVIVDVASRTGADLVVVPEGDRRQPETQAAISEAVGEALAR